MKGLGFESYVCQLCVVILLLPLLSFNNTYEYGNDDVNCLGGRILSNVIWHSGCALALGVEGHRFKPWWVKHFICFANYWLWHEYEGVKKTLAEGLDRGFRITDVL